MIDSNVHKTAAIQHHADVQFVIFGGGAEFESAKEKAKALPNVMINGLLPQGRVSEVYSLVAAILEIKNGRAESFTGGREYAVENASKEKCTAKYVETIISTIIE